MGACVLGGGEWMILLNELDGWSEGRRNGWISLLVFESFARDVEALLELLP